ncbi:peptidase S51 family protein [Thraustotheca clavata]|uniref:Peptidase S51 family protein n=1 Tax=Thraustotheca clavata TaxID=74557 RepID=A0A1V9ZV99_9STRA|nr:peptidase S51 family protein [Thraustotheca clavata]
MEPAPSKPKGGRPRDGVWADFDESTTKIRACICTWCRLEMKSEPKRMIHHLAQKCKHIDLVVRNKYLLRWNEMSANHEDESVPRKIQKTSPKKRKILIAGGNFNTVYLKYMAALTGKPRPRICFLPTANGDSQSCILEFYQQCAPLNVEPFVQLLFVSKNNLDFDEMLLSMDAIVCSGGNTVNQQAIWKAHGIDDILKQAWDKGIVLGGASAGGLCWFEEGTTDSRPKRLTTVKCLGFLPGSHCPHYDSQLDRRPLYQKLISTGELKPGYACDDDAGIYFEDHEPIRAVTARADARVYYVSMVNGQIQEQVLPTHSINTDTSCTI